MFIDGRSHTKGCAATPVHRPCPRVTVHEFARPAQLAPALCLEVEAERPPILGTWVELHAFPLLVAKLATQKADVAPLRAISGHMSHLAADEAAVLAPVGTLPRPMPKGPADQAPVPVPAVRIHPAGRPRAGATAAPGPSRWQAGARHARHRRLSGRWRRWRHGAAQQLQQCGVQGLGVHAGVLREGRPEPPAVEQRDFHLDALCT
mmetsp:Transcript_56644/g.181859  ORF Transcript_56644/g.181859 Transcript_56644/m.181859 type:complete len:206 (+) Transcript_56644:34-651(+)